MACPPPFPQLRACCPSITARPLPCPALPPMQDRADLERMMRREVPRLGLDIANTSSKDYEYAFKIRVRR